MEGFTQTLSKFIPALKSADHSTLYQRIKNLNLGLSVNPEMLSENVVVAMDSTGIKVSNRGEWIREKWRVRRGWITVHTMIDGKTNQIPGIEVADEPVRDEQIFDLLLDQKTSNCAENRVKLVLGDGGYDRDTFFHTLEKGKIQSGIKTRHDTSTRSKNMKAKIIFFVILTILNQG